MARMLSTLVGAAALMSGIANAQLPACNAPDANYDMAVQFPRPNVYMMYKVDTANNCLKVKAVLTNGNGMVDLV